MTKDSKKLRTCLIVVTVCFFVILLIIFNSDTSQKEPTINVFGETYDIDNRGACYMSHQFVEDRLKSPSSAKFQNCYDAYVSYLGNQTYSIYTYVDSQNSFGATIRTYYIAEMIDRQNDYWNLRQVIFE